MATYTFYPSTSNSGWASSYDNGGSYTKARAGTGSYGVAVAIGSATDYIGQTKSGAIVGCFETYLEFDTSSLAGKTITSATLSIYPTTLANSGGSWTNEARLYDYGTSLTTADYVAGASISGYTSLATLTSAASTTGAYRAFTDVALPANINKTGKTRIGIFSSEQRLNSAPTGQEYVAFDGEAGTNPPKLVVVTADEGGLTKTLGALTISSTVSIETFGVLSKSLGSLLISAAGLQTSAGTGVMDKTLGALTLSSAIGIETFGIAEVTLGSLTLNTAALVPREGVVSQTLGALVVDGIAARNTTGVVSATLGALTLATSTLNGIQGAASVTLGSLTLTAAESAPPWPFIYDFPQTPLDGTWRPELGDDTLRSDREVGARQYRTRNGGNYRAASFAIMLKTKAQRDELDRFYVNDCKHGTQVFTWEDPETGDIERWRWMAPPAYGHVARENYRVECAVRKEAA